jgi:protein kinase-like protein/PEGA domain-containing protein
VLHFFDPQRRFLTRDDPSSFAAPAQFGPFRVLHQIGVGALGPVFRTYEPDRDRLVAVKAFRIDITPEQARSLADELSRAAEAGLFHPSIVEPIAAGVEGSVAYNAEEYVAAESLDVAMRHYAPAAIDTVLPFITQLAGAIDFARAAGVGHGALHPRDVFMLPEEARVTGFGVVEALERVGFRAPVRRPYSPPERIAGSSWSTPADVFSLAAISYELLTGRRPAGVGAEIGSLAPGAADSAATGPLHAVLVRAMDEDPSRRYPTALAFASALETAAHGKAASETAPAAAASAPPQAAEPVPVPPVVSAPAPVAAIPSPAAPTPVVKFPDPPHRKQDPLIKREKVGEPPAARVEDDVAAERDEDEAHHELTLRELKATARRDAELERVPDVPMDEDSEAEAEADRYAADDFLLDAAGAASAREHSPADEFRPRKEAPLDLRVLDTDHAVVKERPARLFDTDDLRGDDPPEPRRDEPEMPPAAAAYSGPTFGQPDTVYTEPEPRSSRLPLAMTLLFGILAGFVGGYVFWGRATAPGAGTSREFSEQAVAPPSSRPGSTPAPAPGGAGTPASAPTTGGGTSAGKPAAGATKPATPPPVVSEAPPSASRTARGGTSGRGSAAPAPNGILIVRSTPNGAGVTVNGQWRGRTPLVLENLPFARYDVRVVQPGFTTARQAVTLSASDSEHTLSLRLQQREAAPPPATRSEPTRAAPDAEPQAFTGSVFVDSRPRGARVFIDGKPVGTTPLSVPDVRIGSHVVRLELPDHQIWSATATVTAGQQSRVTGSLERIQ